MRVAAEGRPADAETRHAGPDALIGLFVLIACQVLGKSLRQVLHLPLPGSLVGMLILPAGLTVRGSRTGPSGRGACASVAAAAEPLIRHMGLLFVPAGVGLVTEADLLRNAWLPLAAGLIGSTLLGLIVTGLVMHCVTRVTDRREATLSRPRSGRRPQ